MGGTTTEELEYSNPPTRICGGDEAYAVDVISDRGKKALVTTQDGIRSQLISGTITIGTTRVELKVSTSRLEDRSFLVIQPLNGKIYVGDANVTTSTGMELSNKQIMEKSIYNVPLYAIATVNTLVYVEESK